MPRYAVTLHAKATVEAVVFVDAVHKDEARQKALWKAQTQPAELSWACPEGPDKDTTQADEVHG